MKSCARGKGTSKPEVQEITRHGVWLLVNGTEYMLPFSKFPWFKRAKVEDVLNLRLIHSNHLYWPNLDVDLGIDTLENPDRFPLMDRVEKKREYRVRPK